jgi:hypothetical protein
MTIGRVWRRARQAAFAAEVAASPLARTPYDLRHAAVSTWLNGGVPPTTVAEWAGHSVEVLLRIYAKCLDGGDALVRRRVQAALGYTDTATETPVRTSVPDATGLAGNAWPAATAGKHHARMLPHVVMQASSDTVCWSASTPLGRGRGAMLVDVDIAEFGGRTAGSPDRHLPVCGGAAGSCTVTRSPPAGRGVRVRVPSCAWVMLLTIARPRPTPAWSVRRRSVPR